MQPTLVFLPGKSHRQRSLGGEGGATTERLNSIHWLCCRGQVFYLGAILFFFYNYEEADFLRFFPPLYPSYVV